MSSNNTLSRFSVINEIDSILLTKIVRRICQEYPNEPFTKEERERLLETLKIEKKHQQVDDKQQTTSERIEQKQLFDTLISCLNYIFQEASFQLMKLPVLKEKLSALAINDEKTQIIMDAWSSQAKNIIDKRKKHALPLLSLENMDYSFHQTLSSFLGGKASMGIINFRLNADGNESSDLKLEFSEQELFSFYETLEAIQNQLDQIV